MNIPNILDSKDPSLQKNGRGEGGGNERRTYLPFYSLITGGYIKMPQTPEAETAELHLPQQLCVTDTRECAARPNIEY